MPKNSKISKLYNERNEILHDLQRLREDRKEYYRIKNELEQEGTDKHVEDVAYFNIIDIESEIMEKYEQLRIIERGPYMNGKYDKTESYHSLYALARKKALRKIAAT